MKETPRAKQAWADYLALGEDRSLEKLLHRYQTDTKPVPTRNITRLKQWSAAFGWQQRLKDIADARGREAEERDAAYRRSIMESGYALQHERIKSLNSLARILYAELLQDSKRWLADVKSVGSGKFAERVDIERFNHQEIEQFRGLLDDISRELGERKQGQSTEAGDKDDPLTAMNRVLDEMLEEMTRDGVSLG